MNVFHGTGSIDLPEPQGIAATWHFIKGLCGNTSPGAVLPFGKYSVAPYSGGYSSGYGINCMNCGGPIRQFSSELRLRGFAHFQNSGTGATNIYYNYAVVKPFYGEPAMDYSVSDESGEPGYYSCRLSESGIFCELTVSPFCAVHRYTFTENGGRIYVDFSHDGLYADVDRLRGRAEELSVIATSQNTLEAEAVLQGVRLYFAVKFSGKGRLDGENVFCADFQGQVTVRVSVSAESVESAVLELEKENRDFDSIRCLAAETWEEALSAIDVECGDENELRIFYSNLYQTLVKPSDWGSGGFLWKGEPFVADIVTMWDIYKTQLPLLFCLYPAISRDFIAMVTRLGHERGRMPHSLMLSSNLNMEAKQARFLGAYAVYDGWKRGVEADWNSALDAVMTDLFRADFEDFTKTGVCEKTTHILDMAEGCAAAAELAEALGRGDDAELLRKLWENRKNAFDPKTGLLYGDREYYEGNHWNYSFRPMRDMAGRVELCGGKENFEALLDRFFGFTHGEDVSARFEGFNNETDMETPYAYHSIGAFDKLCDILDSADKFSFRDSKGGAGPGAIPGNNDSGGLSSCYIWNSLGLFPVSGQDLMLLSRPKFDRAKLKLANGKILTVVKNGSGKYPASVSFNGTELPDRKVSVTGIMGGGEIVFEMK
ncbi:MAG: glycoside hydrolase family 92 protein [Clostridia bacterium]|nr:glycoside hydrolase family 92 protein [Clostridia bacterium]